VNFTNLEFYIFFPLVIGGYWILKNNTWRKWWLLGWSYYFYAWWDYRFVTLLLFQTLADFFIGKAIATTRTKLTRNFLLIVSLTITLSLLAFFKYSNFFIATLRRLTDLDLHTLQIILPLGISFYTFRSISYIVDIHQKRLSPSNSLLDYALFINFFPVMIAGPIVRAKELLPQFYKKVKNHQQCILDGIRLFVIGLFQKIFIADRLALFVNPVFENASVYGTLTCWLAIMAYSLQIFCDFQGYSNMAIGTGRMLGYNIPRNFNWPYIATNISDFWRRWHITLSTWIRDYLYIPLGGSRKGLSHTIFNLLFAMSLCGLWHGAGWTFLFWGFLHGCALSVRIIWKNIVKTNMLKLPAWLITQMAVLIGWVFFRSINIEHAKIFLKQLFTWSSGVFWPQPFVLFILIAAIVIHIYKALLNNEKELLPISAYYTPAILFCMLWLLIVFPPKEFTPFVYAQF